MWNPKNILVAIDFGDFSEDALQRAVALGQRLSAKVHAVHAYSIAGNQDIQALLPDAIHEVEMIARQKLSRIVTTTVPPECLGELVVIHGDPAKCIGQAAVQLGADMIVVGTHARRGLSRLLLGSVAEEVVRTAPCPVLVARDGTRAATSH